MSVTYTATLPVCERRDGVSRPDWLRKERAYRVYIRGLRYSLISFVLVGLLGLLGKAGILSLLIAGVGVMVFGLAGGISVIAGGIGWLLVPDKHRANLHQGSFLAMVCHDIFTGIPQAPR